MGDRSFVCVRAMHSECEISRSSRCRTTSSCSLGGIINELTKWPLLRTNNFDLLNDWPDQFHACMQSEANLFFGGQLLGNNGENMAASHRSEAETQQVHSIAVTYRSFFGGFRFFGFSIWLAADTSSHSTHKRDYILFFLLPLD